MGRSREKRTKDMEESLKKDSDRNGLIKPSITTAGVGGV